MGRGLCRAVREYIRFVLLAWGCWYGMQSFCNICRLPSFILYFLITIAGMHTFVFRLHSSSSSSSARHQASQHSHQHPWAVQDRGLRHLSRDGPDWRWPRAHLHWQPEFHEPGTDHRGGILHSRGHMGDWADSHDRCVGALSSHGQWSRLLGLTARTH